MPLLHKETIQVNKNKNKCRERGINTKDFYMLLEGLIQILKSVHNGLIATNSLFTLIFQITQIIVNFVAFNLIYLLDLRIQ